MFSRTFNPASSPRLKVLHLTGSCTGSVPISYDFSKSFTSSQPSYSCPSHRALCCTHPAIFSQQLNALHSLSYLFCYCIDGLDAICTVFWWDGEMRCQIQPGSRPPEGSIWLSDMSSFQGQVWIKQHHLAHLQWNLHSCLLFCVVCVRCHLTSMQWPRPTGSICGMNSVFEDLSGSIMPHIHMAICSHMLSI